MTFEEEKKSEETSKSKKLFNKLKILKQIMDILRGKEDVREKLSWLFAPANPKTASNLTISQSEFVADAFMVTKYFPEFEPLQDLAKEILQTCCSIKGKRVEDAIKALQSQRGTGQQIGIFGAIKEKVKEKIEKG